MYKIKDGEYELDEKGFPVTVEYIEEVLQNVRLLILTQRGIFYPDKNYGSHIKERAKKPFEKYFESYIRQALDDFDGVFLTDLSGSKDELKLEFLINDKEKEVCLKLNDNI